MMFLFDAERNLLAEISLDGGRLRHLVLTGAGERLLEPFIGLWQTRGVPLPKTIGDATYYEHVLTRDPGFAAALTSWANMKGFCSIEVPDNVIPLWEMLARLPLEASERFAFLLAIRLTPPGQLAEWKSCLDEAELAWSRERRHARQTVQSIKNKMSAHLARPFAKTK
ncbi:MAG TPA: hypothetical protein VMU11_03250 [Verrucomicrobiae bacterium]|nr:hypothetical protein [Verrucomicrobiae bacterium]